MRQLIIICTLVVTWFGARAALAADCEVVCNETSSCGKICYFEGYKMTCGQFGVCKPPPPVCTPNWQQISSTPAGYVEYNDYTINQCNTFAASQVVQHDLNQCDPNHLERTFCSYQIVQAYYGCCFWGCYPQYQDGTSCHF